MADEAETPDPDNHDMPTERDVRLACIHASIQAFNGQAFDPATVITGAEQILAFVNGGEA